MSKWGFTVPSRERFAEMVWSEWHVEEEAVRARRAIDWWEWAGVAFAVLFFLALVAAAGYFYGKGWPGWT